MARTPLCRRRDENLAEVEGLAPLCTARAAITRLVLGRNSAKNAPQPCRASVRIVARSFPRQPSFVSNAPIPPAAANRPPTPQIYTPTHLAEKILASRPALEGERKQVTVLFPDLKGSMKLLANRDPEEARRILDQALERMMEAVHRFEGTVNQVMGDGIMALFGAPLALEDHAVRACYAARRMQKSMRS